MSSLIIDSSYLIFKSFFAYPKTLTGPDNQPIGAFYGFSKNIISLLKLYQPDDLVFAKDLPTPTWRHKLYSGYKQGRPEIDPTMVAQIPLIHEWTAKISKNCYAFDGYEADDIIFSATVLGLGLNPEKLLTSKDQDIFESENESQPDFRLTDLVNQLGKTTKEVLIFSSDRDLYQLLAFPGVKFLRSKKTGETFLYGLEEFREEFGIEPIQWLDYKALVGDNSDNLKGLEGVGPKTAKDILNKIYCLEAFYEMAGMENKFFLRSKIDLSDTQKQALKEFVENPSNQKILDKLKTNFESVRETYLLGCLQLVPDLDRLSSDGFDLESSRQTFSDYGFKSLEKDLESFLKKQKASREATAQESLF